MKKMLVLLFSLIAVLSCAAQREYKTPSRVSEDYHRFRNEKTFPPYGLERVAHLMGNEFLNEKHEIARSNGMPISGTSVITCMPTARMVICIPPRWGALPPIHGDCMICMGMYSSSVPAS